MMIFNEIISRKTANALAENEKMKPNKWRYRYGDISQRPLQTFGC